MKHWRIFFLAALIAGGLSISAFVTSCSTLNRTIAVAPEIPGASFIGNKACLDCHAVQGKNFHGSIHQRVSVDHSKVAGGTSCESCHGPGSLHAQGGGGRGKSIHNPGKDSDSCMSCHVEIHAELRLPHHHPVLEKKMNCVQCHDPHGSDIHKTSGNLSMARMNQECAACHRDQARQFLFEHEALREGCTVCHSPHGSINQKMLVERDNNLCLKCHAQVHSGSGDIYIGATIHTSWIKRGNCWSSGCHSAVHGSNIDTHLRY